MLRTEKDVLQGQGLVDMTAVTGAKCRESNEISARVIERVDANTLRGFVAEHAEPDTVVHTYDAAANEVIPNLHESVKHSVFEDVNGIPHTNGIESIWVMLKRARMGIFHKNSPRHLRRCGSGFAGKQNIRKSDMLDQMRNTVARTVGRNLFLKEFAACNGMDSGAGS